MKIAIAALVALSLTACSPAFDPLHIASSATAGEKPSKASKAKFPPVPKSLSSTFIGPARTP